MFYHKDFLTVVLNSLYPSKCRLLHRLRENLPFGGIMVALNLVEKKTGKSKIACKLCCTTLKYSGNTTNLADHNCRKHPIINIQIEVDRVNNIN